MSFLNFLNFTSLLLVSALNVASAVLGISYSKISSGLATIALFIDFW